MHTQHPQAAGMHPALAASIAGALSSAEVLRRAQYITALRSHDWHFSWSDDSSAVQRGRAERQALLGMAQALDPDFEIWDLHSPADQRNGALL